MRLDSKGYRPSKKILIRSGMVLLGTIVLVIVVRVCEGELVEEVTQIERDGYGGSVRNEELNLQIEGEEEQEVVLEISPRLYSEEDLEDLFLEAMDELKTVMLGRNKSLDFITEDLNLVYTLENYPFQISWQFSDYDVIDINGRLKLERLIEKDPFCQGMSVSVNVSLHYEQFEGNETIDMKFYPRNEEQDSIQKKVLDSVFLSDESSREESYLNLPDMIEGKAVVWVKRKDSNVVVLMVVGGLTSVLLIGVERQKLMDLEKKKKEQMLFDYPEIVGQMIILMGAGMTAKKAWKKIVEDYQIQKKKSGSIRWAYEEMEFTFMEMKNGIPELECYERFAKRCDLMPYVKLGALLAQNLKKGTKGLWIQLEMEAHQSMNERKNQIKRLGEEAGTKLLLPMLLMLIVVLLIVIVPAFLSIQI